MKALKIFSVFVLILLQFSAQGTDFFWKATTSQSWDDPGNWYKTDQGIFTTGVIPNENSLVYFIDDLVQDGETIDIAGGNFDVGSITVTTDKMITISCNGTFSNNLNLNIYGDLSLTAAVMIAHTSPFRNRWKFVGDEGHTITTDGVDLINIEIHPGSTFDQQDDLLVSNQIRMFGGVWDTNGHEVTSDFLWFRDNEGSANPFPKTLNITGSSIYCEEWDSRLTYGSLTVVGPHKIYADVFTGSPQQLNGDPFEFDEIYLQEYTDNQAPLVANYNFECTNCLVNKIIIDDTGITKLAGKFTLVEELRVNNQGSIIQFSSGNGRDEEVILNGTVITPTVSGCEERTVFENRHSDFITIIREDGVLTISDAVINNAKATGGATFQVSNGIVKGASTGWNEINVPSPLDYVWRGPVGATGDWDDVNNWKTLQGGFTGCLPTAIDNVIIDEGSKGDIRIPSNLTAECNNLVWTNEESVVLTLDGTSVLRSELNIRGGMDLSEEATIIGDERHEILFTASSQVDINTRGVALPNIRFRGELATWQLENDLTCDLLVFEGGTLNTLGKKITTDEWSSVESSPKQFNFSSSTIEVNGEMALSRTEDHNVTVNAGTSKIICEDLICFVHELNDVEFRNTVPITLDDYEYTFNELILNGSAPITTADDLILNRLNFNSAGGTLILNFFKDFTVYDGINSNAPASDPAVLRSSFSTSRATVQNPDGNICISGHIKFDDIDMFSQGVAHAPYGVDGGNNIGIDFTSFPTSQNVPLYWTGKTNTNWAIRSNWSSVSGGCSTNFNPNNRPKLIFNEHSLYNNNEVIIYANTTTNHIEFLGIGSEFMMDNRVNLYLDDITVDNSWVTLDGNDYNLNGTLDVDNSSLLDLQTSSLTANTINNGNNCLIIVRDELAEE